MTFETAGKVVSGAVDALKGSPMAIALLVINVMFIVFVTILLNNISENAQARDKSQTEMTNTLIKSLSDCRAAH